MLSDEWLSRYGLLENFNASVTRTRTGTGTWTSGVTAIALCTSCSRAKKQCILTVEHDIQFKSSGFFAMKRGERENYTLPVLNIPYLSSLQNIKFHRRTSSYFMTNSPYFAAKIKSMSRLFFLLVGEISR